MPIEYRDASYRPGSYGSGKLVRRTEATWGALRATGANKSEAKAALLELVEAQLENLYKRRYLSNGEVTFALYFNGCWCYDIVRANRVACSNSMSAMTFASALEAMTRHFEQYTEAVPSA